MGVVTAVGTAVVTVQIGGDTAITTDLPYLASYANPQVGDVVQILTDRGTALVLGPTATGVQHAFAQLSSGFTSITTTQVDLLQTGSLISNGLQTFRVIYSFDSWSSTVANDRLGLRIRRSLNGGAFADVARMLPRVTVASNSEGGGTLMVIDPATTAGTYVYKATAVREAGTGSINLNGAPGQPMTLTAETF